MSLPTAEQHQEAKALAKKICGKTIDRIDFITEDCDLAEQVIVFTDGSMLRFGVDGELGDERVTPFYAPTDEGTHYGKPLRHDPKRMVAEILKLRRQLDVANRKLQKHTRKAVQP